MVSIIIPAYNASKSIEKCLMSIVSQTFKDIEIIVVDDGSQDNTAEICESIKKGDNRIVYIHQENGGVSSARNTGIAVASGKYIMFVDADDLLPKNAVNIMVSMEEKTRAELVCASYVLEKTFGRKKEIKYFPKEYKNRELVSEFDHLYYYIHHAPWGKLYIRDIIIRNELQFPVEIPFAEDSIFFINYLQYVNYMVLTNKIVYRYNFKDAGSAGRRFYPSFHLYLRRVLDEIKVYYNNQGCDETFDLLESRLGELYFTWCIKHFTLHITNAEVKNDLIRKSADVFMNKMNDESIYERNIKEQNWEEISKNWIKIHRCEYLKFRFNTKIHNLLSKICG